MEFDFLRPVTKTRDEVFLVKFRGGMKNAGELLYNAATQLPDFKSYWLENYTKFANLIDKPAEERFNLLAPFTSAEFLKFMALTFKHFDKLGFSNASQDYAKLMALSNPYFASVTNIELMLHEFLTYDFCKKIYIYDTAFSDITKKFLRDSFGRANGPRISLLEGSLLDIITAKPEITTIICDSADEVLEVIESEPEGTDKFYKKLFLISALPNIRTDADAMDKSFYKHQKFLSETKQRFKCESNWFQLKYVTDYKGDKSTVHFKGEKPNDESDVKT